MSRSSLVPTDVMRLPRVGDPCCSPDGRLIAFTVSLPHAESDTVRSRVWLVAADGASAARPLSAGPHDAAPRFAPSGDALAWIGAAAPGAEEGEPATRLWLADAAACAAVARADAAAGDAPAAANGSAAAAPADTAAAAPAGPPARCVAVLPAGAGEPVWSPDGTRIAFTAPVDRDGPPAGADAARRRREAPLVVRRLDSKADGLGLRGATRRQLHVVDVAAGVVRQLTHGSADAREPAWTPDGRAIAFAAEVDDDGAGARPTSAIHLVDGDGGEPRRLTPAGGLAAAPCVTADGATVVYVGRPRYGLGCFRLLAVGLDGGEPRDLDPALDRSAMVGDAVESGCPPQETADGRVLFAVADRGSTHLRLARLDGGGSEPLLADPARAVVRASLSPAGTIACAIADAFTPGEVHALQLDGDGEPRPLTALVAEALPEVEIAPPRERTFTAPDGTELHGWVIGGEPGAGPRPLLVDVHGGPHSAWTPTLDPIRIYHQTLVAEGWAVLRLNPRASEGYGERFMTSTVGRWGLADEGDFHAAIDALVADGIADPERLAVCGYSYGGYMTCWLTSRTTRFRAAVAGGCVCDLRSHVGSADIGVSFGEIALGITPGESLAPLEAQSPITHVDDVETPTLVVHGEADDRYPIGQGELWFTALRARGVETELVRYPGGSHLFVVDERPSHRVDFGRRTIAWLRAHVGAAADGGATAAAEAEAERVAS